MTPALAEASEVLKIAEAFPHMVTVRISKDVLRALIEAARGKQ